MKIVITFILSGQNDKTVLDAYVEFQHELGQSVIIQEPQVDIIIDEEA